MMELLRDARRAAFIVPGTAVARLHRMQFMFACTMCHTDLAAEVRAGLLAGDLWREAAAILLPFLIVLSFARAMRGRSAKR
jgi:hypothetical protein